MKKLLTLPLILLSASVFAVDIDFRSLDVDQDGLISLQEAKANDSLSAVFNELDYNQDGYLTMSEISAPRED